MKSKSFNTFSTRIIYFDDDIDLLDVLKISICDKGDLTDESSQYVLKDVDASRHSHLARRKNSDGGRKLVVNHLRRTVYTAYIKDVYEEVTLYLKDVLTKAAQNKYDSGRIIGEHTFKFDAKKVLEAGSFEKVAEMLTASVFQSLESERSTLNLLSKVSAKLGLGVDETCIKEAIPYLETRHFLVHSDGRVTDDFQGTHPQVAVDQEGYLVLDSAFIRKFREAIAKLMAEYDRKVVLANILRPEDLMK